jgi:hypothetical protein
MSDSKEPRVPPNRKAPAAAFPARAGATVPARTPGGRHSAITRNLRNYASYKSWAEKMRSNWEPGKDPAG